ncbi:MAG: response regulator transcription factor [Rectinemataceae bacterium]
MGLHSGPLRIRLGVDGVLGKALTERAASAGLVLAREGEAADLVALPSALSLEGSRGGETGARFSRREVEILEYLADGWSNAEIASVLRIGVRTVRFHLEGIYAKLGVVRRGEAVREALRAGLVRFDF